MSFWNESSFSFNSCCQIVLNLLFRHSCFISLGLNVLIALDLINRIILNIFEKSFCPAISASVFRNYSNCLCHKAQFCILFINHRIPRRNKMLLTIELLHRGIDLHPFLINGLCLHIFTIDQSPTITDRLYANTVRIAPESVIGEYTCMYVVVVINSC